ncbi:hypothetical protein BDF22DRAFT_112166 [Syncephalis plumigaleata]|nr:hypothetical protein BDF22DRAFT_112166 [Syncephalis plumigaleata]
MLNVPATKLYVRLSLGDQIYQTSISEQDNGRWHEGFEFDVSFHNQLFGVCQLDLYDMRYLLPDRHLGRAEISLAHLRSMPDQFTTFYEFWDRRHTVANLGQAALSRTLSSNIGAIQVRIGHRFTQQTNRYSIGTDFHILAASPSMYAHLDQRFQRRLRAAVSKAAEREFIKTEQDSNGDPSSFQPSFDADDDDDDDDDDDILDSNNNSNNDQLPRSLVNDNTVDVNVSITRSDKRVSNRTMMEYLSDLLVTDETRQVLKAIMRLYMIFGQGLEVGHVELLAGISILRSYHAQISIIRTGIKVQRLMDIDLPAHFYRFCMASYGWRGLNFFGKGNGIIRDSIRKHSDAASVREYLSLQDDELLAYEFHAGLVFRPSYFIAIDKETDSIVLCIRGTMSIMDTLTDLVCDYQQWKGGLVHAGILSAAQWFFTDVVPQILAYCRQHDMRRIRIIGHSLGGSTASVLTILLVDYLRMLDNIDVNDEKREEEQERMKNGMDQDSRSSTPSTESKTKADIKSRLLPGDMDVHGYSYGAACCVSLDISRQYADIIDAYVLDNDLVPRLSYGSVMDMKSMVLCAAGLTERHYEEVVSFGFLSNKVTDEEWQSRYRLLDASRQRLTDQDQPQNPKLFLAGTIHHLYREVPQEIIAANPSDPTGVASHGPSSSAAAAAPTGDHASSMQKIPSSGTGDAIADDSRSTPLTAEPVHEQTTQTVSDFTNEPSIRMESSDPLRFSEILIAPNMFLDHMPSAYETAFEQARQCFIRNASYKKA